MIPYHRCSGLRIVRTVGTTISVIRVALSRDDVLDPTDDNGDRGRVGPASWVGLSGAMDVVLALVGAGLYRASIRPTIDC